VIKHAKEYCALIGKSRTASQLELFEREYFLRAEARDAHRRALQSYHTFSITCFA